MPTRTRRLNSPLVALALLLGVWLAASGCAGLGHHQRDLEPATTRLRVVSWNVALGIFLDLPDQRFSRMSRGGYSVRNALAHNPELKNFDVLGVQELCSHDGGVHIQALEAVFPYHRFFGRGDPDRRGECEKGQAIFSRYPIARGGVIQLPPIRRVGRSAIWADIRVPVGEDTRLVRVYNVHLDNAGEVLPAPEGRWHQMKRVLDHYEGWREENPKAGVIFLGDFNALGDLYDPWSEEQTIAEVKTRFRSAIGEYEHTWLALYQLDWIFFDALKLVDARVVRILLSDHYPVVADFLLTDE